MTLPSIYLISNSIFSVIMCNNKMYKCSVLLQKHKYKFYKNVTISNLVLCRAKRRIYYMSYNSGFRFSFIPLNR